MEFRKMVTITLYVRQQKRHRCIEQSFGLWERARVEWFGGMALKHVCYHQFSSVAQLCPTLCDPMNCSMPGLPVHHQLPEFTETHVHRDSDAIQPSHPSGMSQCTSFECPVSCIELGLAIYFTSLRSSHPHLLPESKSLFFTSAVLHIGSLLPSF